jgi:alginate O-acetyltransferase complex protein AlgI
MNALPGLERRNLGLLAAHTLSVRRSVAVGLAAAVLLVLSASSVVGSSFNPFIYFRF